MLYFVFIQIHHTKQIQNITKMICQKLDMLLKLIREKNQTQKFFKISQNKSKDLFNILMHFEFEFIFTNDCYFIYYERNNIKYSINFLIQNNEDNEDNEDNRDNEILDFTSEYLDLNGNYQEGKEFCKYENDIYTLLEMNINTYGNTSNFWQEYPKNDPTFLQL